MGSIFSQLKAASSTEGRNPFISKTGVTVDELLRIRAGETREGDPFFAADLKVSEVLSETPLPSAVVAYNEKSSADKRVPEGPHQAGESVTFYVKLTNPYVTNKLGNVKNFCEAVFDSLGIDDYHEWDAEQWESAIMDKEDGLAAGDGTDAAGAKLIRSSEARISKKDSPYVVSTFAPFENDEDAE